MDKQGQVSIFVIVAVVIIAIIVLFFVVRNNFTASSVPAEFLPVYNLYEECLEADTEVGIGILGLQGGRIDVGDYRPGSDFAPFSSHLDFFGSSIGYWYYLSGNGQIIENPPTKAEMENELGKFIEERINGCDFSQYYGQGFFIEFDDPVADVQIQENRVEVALRSNLVVERGGNSARRTIHEVSVSSKLGKLYDNAREVYNSEKDNLFLEEYSIDVLRTYAPVDGVEVSCGPEIWKTPEVVSGLREALSENLASVKFNGNYYNLDEESDDYFVVDTPVSEPVRLMYSQEWPSKVEISGEGVDDLLMVAEPVGNQEGLGVLGFCYVPYHYVYDVAFPVMVQVGDGLEMFQFPVVVIIDNNLAREADLISIEDDEAFDICEFSNSDAEIYTYDNNLNPVEARVQFECVDQTCSLGETVLEGGDAVLRTQVPQCFNGELVARAEGFREGSAIFSSNTESFAELILDREYEVTVDLRLSGGALENGESAVVYFVSEDDSKTVALPDNGAVALSEGNYDISVYVYGDSSITIPASSKSECVDVARGGIFGLFGSTKEECFNIDFPETQIDSALRGGGKTTTYLLESELANGVMTLEVQELPVPGSLDQLQLNYELFENSGVGVSFR